MARFVSESTKKQVKEAVKTESEKRQDSPANAATGKKESTAKPPLPSAPAKFPPQSDKYIPKVEPPKKEEVKKEVKASIDTIISGKDAPPPDTNARVIDALISTSAPEQKPPAIESPVQDPGAAYRQSPRGAGQDNPSGIYQAITGSAQGSQDGPGSIYRRDQAPREDENSLRQYANKDAHQKNLDSRGQSDIFGTEEHTLSGRIKKMYSRN